MAGEREALRDWHRLFGLLLIDFFRDSPFTVEVERDLSTQQQFLDVVIVRRVRGRFSGQLPDGLDDLAAHNLLTFKSHREALDDWAIRELLGHFVTYRKLVSRSPSRLLPMNRFRLFAVAARFPHNLAGQVPWRQIQAGVYDCQWGLDVVRVLVAGELPREARNAPLHLFSASPDLVGFASAAYRQRSEDTSLLLGQLFEGFRAEGVTMAFTMEDFKRQYIKEHFGQLTPQEKAEVLRSLPPEERLAGLPAAEILAALPPEERMAGLPAAERLAGLPAEQLLAAVSVEQIREYLDRLTAERPAATRKPRRKK